MNLQQALTLQQRLKHGPSGSPVDYRHKQFYSLSESEIFSDQWWVEVNGTWHRNYEQARTALNTPSLRERIARCLAHWSGYDRPQLVDELLAIIIEEE